MPKTRIVPEDQQHKVSQSALRDGLNGERNYDGICSPVNLPEIQPSNRASCHHIFQWLPEPVRVLLRQVGRMVFRAGRLGLRLEHGLYRLRYLRLPLLYTLPLLLLDPVAIELSPLLRLDKGLSLQQKIARFLVRRACCQGGRFSSCLQTTTIEICEIDAERLVAAFQADFLPESFSQNNL